MPHLAAETEAEAEQESHPKAEAAPKPPPIATNSLYGAPAPLTAPPAVNPSYPMQSTQDAIVFML